MEFVDGKRRQMEDVKVWIGPMKYRDGTPYMKFLLEKHVHCLPLSNAKCLFFLLCFEMINSTCEGHVSIQRGHCSITTSYRGSN